MNSGQIITDDMYLEDWQNLQNLSKYPMSPSPIIMLLRTRTSSRRIRNGHAKYRWKIYLWQLPDDLISWYLPIQSTSEIVNIIRSFGIS